MRKCSVCNLEKELDHFYTRKDNNYTLRRCKKCIVSKGNKRNSENRQKYNEAHRLAAKRRQEKDPLVRVKEWLKHKYKITIQEYDLQLERQNEVCYICKQKDKIRLAVDHCHNTNTLRGLLCANCNHGIGKFRDDPELLKTAIEYLSKNGIWGK